MQRSYPTYRAVAILKMESTKYATTTKRFFSIADAEREELQKMGVALLPDDLPKMERFWYINTATVLFSGSGANNDVNVHLAAEHEGSLKKFIVMAHPNAENWLRRLCGLPPRGFRFTVCCNSTNLTAADFAVHLT